MNANLIIETNNETVSLEPTAVEALRKLHAESVITSRFVSITAEERQIAAKTHFMIGAIGFLGAAVANQLFQLFSTEAGVVAL